MTMTTGLVLEIQLIYLKIYINVPLIFVICCYRENANHIHLLVLACLMSLFNLRTTLENSNNKKATWISPSGKHINQTELFFSIYKGYGK